MEMIYYTVVAVLLYMISDWILNRIEIHLGKRLPNRSLIFFVIILILSVSSFSLISALYDKPVSEDETATPATSTSVPE